MKRLSDIRWLVTALGPNHSTNPNGLKGRGLMDIGRWFPILTHLWMWVPCCHVIKPTGLAEPNSNGQSFLCLISSACKRLRACFGSGTCLVRSPRRRMSQRRVRFVNRIGRIWLKLRV
jgi:hypothetical protein